MENYTPQTPVPVLSMPRKKAIGKIMQSMATQLPMQMRFWLFADEEYEYYQVLLHPEYHDAFVTFFESQDLKGQAYIDFWLAREFHNPDWRDTDPNRR